MKIVKTCSRYFSRPLWLSVGVGCALACAPLGSGLRAQGDTAKEEASKPQPSDPVASKKGALNKAEPGGAAKLASADAAFLNKAGAANAAEIKMAELALKNAESQEVKDFAQMMSDHHAKANEELGLVAKEHNVMFPPDAPEKEKAMGKKMLDVKGAAFDKAYIDHAVKDHAKVVADYKKAAGSVKDAALTAYIQKMTPMIEGHSTKAKEIQATLKK